MNHDSTNCNKHFCFALECIKIFVWSVYFQTICPFSFTIQPQQNCWGKGFFPHPRAKQEKHVCIVNGTLGGRFKSAQIAADNLGL